LYRLIAYLVQTSKLDFETRVERFENAVAELRELLAHQGPEWDRDWAPDGLASHSLAAALARAALQARSTRPTVCH
jgi:hypothetical protein